MTNNLWNHENPITDYTDEITIPRWIESDISPSDIAAIVEGGCASGAYGPAIFYHSAEKVLHEYGDAKDGVLNYIEESLGELPTPPKDTSWSGLACFYLSYAVELWAASIEDELGKILNEIDSE